MNADHMRDELVRLRSQVEAQQAELLTHRHELARLKRRGRRSTRFLPLVCVVLLVALLPLSLSAADIVFSDLGTAAEVHRADIQALGNSGISAGYDDPDHPGQRIFNPQGLVTREQMASFLARTAGLGNNPPVANAATAVNAQAVGGYAPGALVRANGAQKVEAVNLVNTEYSPIVAVSITAPGPGYIILSATTNVYDGTDATTGGAFVRLTNGVFPAPYQEVVLGTGAGLVRETSVGVTYLYQVQAGTRTFQLEAQGFTNNVQALRSTITAIFVPFGPEGAPPAVQTPKD